MRGHCITLALCALTGTANAQLLYVTNQDDDSVSVVDLDLASVIDTIPVGGGAAGPGHPARWVHPSTSWPARQASM